MKDREARELMAENKSDIERLERLLKLTDGYLDKRLTRIEKAWDSKFVKREFWEERKETEH